MIKSIIIDDEADGREALRMALEKYCPEISISGVYATPEEGMQGIRAQSPQLVFLDVQMPNLSGFDILQQLSPIGFEVIFVSAYDQYAIKAIRFSALDYLLKPIDVDDLLQAVKRVKERLEQKSGFFSYESVLYNVRHGANKSEKIAVPSLNGIDFFQADDIVYCSARGSYTNIYLKNGQQHLASKNLKDFENLLSDSGFCRVHHSYLINIKHVTRYVRGEGGYVTLTGDHRVDVSRRRKDEFLAMLDKL